MGICYNLVRLGGEDMVYACDTCHFLFSRVAETEQCPDCGKYTVRPAYEAEQEEFLSRLSGGDKAWNNSGDGSV